jgi:hypothetical protein
LASSIVEDRLTSAIKARLHDTKEKGEKLHDRMFSYLGPLGTFGAQIDVGFAIGMFGTETRKELHSIREIRSKFAHKIVPKDFKDQWVKNKVANLRIAEKYPIKSYEGGPPTILQTGVNPTGIQLADTMLGHSSVSEISTTRSRYVRTAEIFSFLLFVMQLSPYSDKTTPPF